MSQTNSYSLFAEPKKIKWHSLSKTSVLHNLQSCDFGLSEKEVKQRRSFFGYNEVVEEKQKSPFVVFGKQLKNPLIVILIAASLLSGIFGEVIDAIVIISIIFLASFVGFVQEYRSEKATQALKNLAAPTMSYEK